MRNFVGAPGTTAQEEIGDFLKYRMTKEHVRVFRYLVKSHTTGLVNTGLVFFNTFMFICSLCIIIIIKCIFEKSVNNL